MNTRPTKKQKEILQYIDEFIQQQGYGPSYREIMRALDYKSVSTVATHVDGLIARGLLRKGVDNARSLELVAEHTTQSEKMEWLTHKLQRKIRTLREQPHTAKDIEVLRAAAKLLNIDL
jgi:SOS-response transcriptional repressor LexA